MSQARGWLPEELALIPPGPRLAAILAGIDRDSLSDEDLVRLAQARQRLAAHLQAQLLADIHAIGQRTGDLVGGSEEERRGMGECEVAMAMTWTSRAAGWQLSLAEDLVDRLPVVFAALNSGEIDVPRANVFAVETCGLEDAVARRVADQLIGDAGRLTTGQLRARLRRLVIAADPQRASRNAKEQVKGRRVVAELTSEGTADLGGYDLPPHRVAAAMERLTAIARAAKSGGDARKLDQLRADAMLDLLVGEGVATGGLVSGAVVGPAQAPPAPPVREPDDGDRPGARAVLPGPRKGVVDIQVPLTTLLGLSDFPGELAGYGPVIADIARQVVAEQTDATWRFSVYDPHGQLIHHGITRRRPKAEDAAFIRARDRTCRAPGCRRPARQCAIEHTEDWASTKDSRRCNLACLCRRHHLWKHLKHTGLIQITPGTLGFHTPLGQHIVTHPESYVDELELALTDR
jgi:Domain of unknown function (DUF222)